VDKILRWQLEHIEVHCRLLQEHAADPTCSCEVDLTNCVRKHLLVIEGYAVETLPMADTEEMTTLLYDLSIAARDMKEKVAASVCGGGDGGDLDLAEVAAFGREWAKKVETGFTCTLPAETVEEIAMEAHSETPRCELAMLVADKCNSASPWYGKDGCNAATNELHDQECGDKGPAMEAHGLVEGLLSGAGIGVGLVISQKVLEKKEGNPNPPLVHNNPIALSTCEMEHGLGPKLDRCVFELEERNIEKGCPPMGTGTKKCPNPVAICRASISQPVCSMGAESPKVAGEAAMTSPSRGHSRGGAPE